MALTSRKFLCKDGTFVTEQNTAVEMTAKDGLPTNTFFCVVHHTKIGIRAAARHNNLWFANFRMIKTYCFNIKLSHCRPGQAIRASRG